MYVYVYTLHICLQIIKVTGGPSVVVFKCSISK